MTILEFPRRWCGDVLAPSTSIPRDWMPHGEERKAIDLQRYRERRAAQPVTQSMRDNPGPEAA